MSFALWYIMKLYSEPKLLQFCIEKMCCGVLQFGRCTLTFWDSLSVLGCCFFVNSDFCHDDHRLWFCNVSITISSFYSSLFFSFFLPIVLFCSVKFLYFGRYSSNSCFDFCNFWLWIYCQVVAFSAIEVTKSSNSHYCGLLYFIFYESIVNCNSGSKSTCKSNMFTNSLNCTELIINFSSNSLVTNPTFLLTNFLPYKGMVLNSVWYGWMCYAH